MLRYLEPGAAPLLAGLAILARQGRIRFTQQVLEVPEPLTSGPWHLRCKAESGIEIVLDGKTSAYMDVHDSWEIDATEYARHDVYFKRSLDPRRHPPGDYPKLRPTGLVNDVRLDGIDRWEFQRIVTQHVPLARRVREAMLFLAGSVGSLANLGPRPNLALMNAAPSPATPPRVLFMAGVWDPAQVPEDAPAKASEFEAINEMRAGCVRSLRREFGERFFGGIQDSEFARRCYGDLLLHDARAASKRAYISRVRSFPICIATVGLHGSNGWKLAEYVGLSKSIVTEPLRYAVPGRFAAPSHYLEFDSVDTCVAQVGTLMRDDALRASQMQANWDYYNRWMRPDEFARRVLESLGGAMV